MQRRRYSAGYVQHSERFVVQGLQSRRDLCARTSVLQVLLNILQRGAPTPPTQKLLDAFGPPSDRTGRNLALSLPKDLPRWSRTILGDEEELSSPAGELFHRLLPEALGDSSQLMWWVCPETKVSEIYQRDISTLTDQRVDFYVPEARLVIEVDGAQHEEPEQRYKDGYRDAFLLKSGITTERITTTELSIPVISKKRLRNIAKRMVEAAEKNEWLKPDDKQYQVEESYVLAIRLQVVLVELLLSDQLPSDGSSWKIELVCERADQWWAPAIDDLFDWMEPVFLLARQPWKRPELNVQVIDSLAQKKSDAIRIDIDARRRWTDVEITEKGIVYVRSDYIESKPGLNDKWLPVNNFRVECGLPIEYSLEIDRDKPCLEIINKRLFGHEALKPGQWEILNHVLGRKKTIGILPTGGGKSLCYQIAALLQPGITLVVSPIKALMRDQVAELSLNGIHRTTALNSDDRAEEKKQKIENFVAGEHLIIFVSPERLQVPEFRDACTTIMVHLRFQHAVVDEVHCLSEWGHDFRTSYLNLAKTFRRCLSGVPVIGLTATASKNVLTDIQAEFGVSDDDVIYRFDIRRNNLKFKVLRPVNSQADCIADWIAECAKQSRDLPPSGIVFTPHVNGVRGCDYVAKKVISKIGPCVGVFSGSKPKSFVGPAEGFEIQKQKTQDDFKQGRVRVLCATKAFGMGVNKTDVRFTVHYGLPASLEAFYQEAGRAGRDGSAADCLVVASPNDDKLARAVSERLAPRDLKQVVDNAPPFSDLRAQLWLITKELRSIREDFKLVRELLSRLDHAEGGTVTVDSSSFRHGDDEASPLATQIAIFRLSQLGYVDDWTVLDFFNGRYAIERASVNDDQAESKLLNLVSKYKGGSAVPDLPSILSDDPDAWAIIYKGGRRPKRNVLILTLLKWAYEHFNYSRRKSLLNVMELCHDPRLDSDGIREAIDRFFTIDSRTTLIQVYIDSGIERISDWERFILGEISDRPLGWHDEEAKSLHLRAVLGMITRFLESYSSNTALDFLSIGVRLLLGRYNHPDGSGRLTRQLAPSRRSVGEVDSLIRYVLRVGARCDMSIREQLARDLLSLRPTRSQAYLVHKNLLDNVSLNFYIKELSHAASAAITGIEHGLTRD